MLDIPAGLADGGRGGGRGRKLLRLVQSVRQKGRGGHYTFCKLCWPPYLTWLVTCLMYCCCFLPFLFLSPNVLSCSSNTWVDVT